MLDYLYVHVFGVPSIKTGDGRLQAQLPSGFLETEKISWMENDFPYWYEPGIEHHCLWSTTPLSEDRIKQVGGRLEAGQNAHDEVHTEQECARKGLHNG